MSVISESTLSRVWQHANSNRPFAIFTAFRDEVSEDPKERRKINVRRNREAAYILKAKGYGYFFVDGHWIENEGKPDEKWVEEDSIFAIADKENEQDFVDLVVALGKEYNQDAVLIKTSKGIHLYNQAGTIVGQFDQFTPDKLDKIYTRLRGRGDRTFIFECERSDEGFMAALLRNAQKIDENSESLNRLKKLAGITK